MKKLKKVIANFVLTKVINKKRGLPFYVDKTEQMLLSFKNHGYLKEIGWLEAYKYKMPIDQKMNPIPWVTYPFISFISERLNKGLTLFEYGSGNSTIFYSTKVDSVTAVEHDKDWLSKIEKGLPDNSRIIYQELEYGGAYCKESSKGKFDVIIVDGRDRVNCCKNAVNGLKEGGVIILDDSERTQYQEAIQFLTSHGFKKIDFWGISPGLFYLKCTSVYYKEENCLNI